MITEDEWWDIKSGTWSPGAKFIHKAWTRLFAEVGRVFSPAFVRRPGWFDKSVWTSAQQKSFRGFLVKAALQDLGKTERAATRLAVRFIGDYGWKVDDSMKTAVERGAEVRNKLAAAEGGAINGERVARLLRTSETAISRRWRRHRIIAWQKGKRLFYPKWQFRSRKLLPGIAEVLQVFESDDHWRVMRYFLSKRVSLKEERPLDLLRVGKVSDVLEHARHHAQENTW